MQVKPIRILAINPGSRYLGIALFQGAELYDWRLKMNRGERTLKLLVDYISRYQVSVLALKMTHLSRSSKALLDMVAILRKLAPQKGLTLREYSIDEIKGHFFQQGRSNKKRLMEEIARRYPFLYPELQHEQNLKNPYLVRMFEAIALGVLCFNTLDGKKKKGRAV